jgi:hypothetical protein
LGHLKKEAIRPKTFEEIEQVLNDPNIYLDAETRKMY